MRIIAISAIISVSLLVLGCAQNSHRPIRQSPPQYSYTPPPATAYPQEAVPMAPAGHERQRKVRITCPTCGGRGEYTCPTCRGHRYLRQKCPVCNGKGKVCRTCGMCNGKGRLYGVIGHKDGERCPSCGGKGVVDCRRCVTCDGTGKKPCDRCLRRVGALVKPTGTIKCNRCNGKGYIEEWE